MRSRLAKAIQCPIRMLISEAEKKSCYSATTSYIEAVCKRKRPFLWVDSHFHLYHNVGLYYGGVSILDAFICLVTLTELLHFSEANGHQAYFTLAVGFSTCA